MRFIPSAKAVMYMKLLNLKPQEACRKALEEIEKYVPKTSPLLYGGLICVNGQGEFGAWAIGDFVNYFKYAVRNSTMEGVKVFNWQEYYNKK